MPALPYTNPTSIDELYRNILHDVGAPPLTSSTYDSTSMRGLLLNLDYGVYKTGLAEFGSGIDSTVTSGAEVPLTFATNANGNATVTLWNTTTLTASSNTFTLSQDLWLSDGATIASGVTINNNGFRIFCQGELINNGTISANGVAASANTAGTALSYTSTLSATTVGSAGGAGNATGNTAGTNNPANSLGGVGGTGGNGNAHNGAAGGTAAAPGATVELPFSAPWATVGKGFAATAGVVLAGGSGGGSGGGDGTNLPGGGGGGAGIVLIAAQRIAGTGVIAAVGGAGGAAAAAGNSGGGGGGGGGLILLITRSAIPAAQTNAGATTPAPGVSSTTHSSLFGQTVTAAGGAGGAGFGSGNNGSAGAAGTVVLVPA